MEEETKNDLESSNPEESGITMVDVMMEEQGLEEDAEAVLGGGDDSSCTYIMGYLKRQPLYACLTCCPIAGTELAGICLGCSYHCHEGHDLVELYTKRYFKCDCGNSKFPKSNACTLMKEKSAVNSDNKYNHNFRGKYCVCERPYPDPEDDVQDNMMQCILCEDWYHARHLKCENEIPQDDDFSEMICHLCVQKTTFLKFYKKYEVFSNTNDTSINVEDSPPQKKSKLDSETINSKIELKPLKEGSNSKDSDAGPSLEQTDFCKLKGNSVAEIDCCLFFPDLWRQQLCKCKECNEMYKCCSLLFLTEFEDSVAYYESKEKRGADNPLVAEIGSEGSLERGLRPKEIKALAQLDPYTRGELVQGYAELSSSLRDYLRGFAESGTTVSDVHIRNFFEKLSENKKKQKNERQFFCK